MVPGQNQTPEDRKRQEIANTAADALGASLLYCRSVSQFEEKLRSDLVRGYMFGFFDAAAQFRGIRFETEDRLNSYLCYCHLRLLANDVQSPIDFTIESFMRGGTKTFRASQDNGGADYFKWMKEGQLPIRWAALFHEFDDIGGAINQESGSSPTSSPALLSDLPSAQHEPPSIQPPRPPDYQPSREQPRGPAPTGDGPPLTTADWVLLIAVNLVLTPFVAGFLAIYNFAKGKRQLGIAYTIGVGVQIFILILMFSSRR